MGPMSHDWAQVGHFKCHARSWVPPNKEIEKINCAGMGIFFRIGNDHMEGVAYKREDAMGHKIYNAHDYYVSVKAGLSTSPNRSKTTFKPSHNT